MINIQNQIVIISGYVDEEQLIKDIQNHKLLTWGHGLLRFDNPDQPAIIVELVGTTIEREDEFFSDLLNENMLDFLILSDVNRYTTMVHYDGSSESLGELQDTTKEEAQKGNYVWAKALNKYFVWK
jgi:hypothetical protein